MTRYHGLRSHDLFQVSFLAAHTWNAAGIKAPKDELWTASDFQPEVESDAIPALDKLEPFPGEASLED